MAEEKLDDGTLIHIEISMKEKVIEVDFSGSSGIHPGNLNATPAIVRSAVIYALRLKIQEAVPLNEGIMKNVTIILPEGFLNPPFSEDPELCPAVVGGNTETSQRIVDTLLKALGLAACSQGTMNNFLFGNPTFSYYETICGGVGAAEDYPGADAVHQHMTNTRITDPEILEFRYPVRLDHFYIRENSGGPGKWRGGNGVTRKMTFLAPLEITLLSQHRNVAPYGMNGGKEGAKGDQWIIRDNGRKEPMQGIDAKKVNPDDSIIIQTPGGGGWGAGLTKEE
jgi:5-oxoprolinase (ATP-hydrolysing)